MNESGKYIFGVGWGSSGGSDMFKVLEKMRDEIQSTSEGIRGEIFSPL